MNKQTTCNPWKTTKRRANHIAARAIWQTLEASKVCPFAELNCKTDMASEAGGGGQLQNLPCAIGTCHGAFRRKIRRKHRSRGREGEQVKP